MFTNSIKNPVIHTPSNGYNRIDLIPSNERGRPANSFLNTKITPPAKKPPTNAPKNPEGTPARAKVFSPPAANGTLPQAKPLEAIEPATKPATKPGFSAIENAIYPAKIGSMKPNATPPIFLNREEIS